MKMVFDFLERYCEKVFFLDSFPEPNHAFCLDCLYLCYLLDLYLIRGRWHPKHCHVITYVSYGISFCRKYLFFCKTICNKCICCTCLQVSSTMCEEIN